MVAVISCGGTIYDSTLTGLSIISQDLLCDSPSFASHQSTSVVGTCFISETMSYLIKCRCHEVLLCASDALSLSKDKHHEDLLCE